MDGKTSTGGGHDEARTRRGRLWEWGRRAAVTHGPERHTLLLIGKCTLAATLAWFTAADLLHAQSPAFAPFSAVLIMNVTVYQSIAQSLRYVAAVVTGVAVQAALGFLAGPDLLTFVLVAAIALTIGQWKALGAQRSQVATAAFFAFSTYVSATSNTERATQLGQIVLLVLIGCSLGLLVNVVLVPPLRYRSAEHGIRALAGALESLLADMGPAMRDGEFAEEHARHWRSRSGHAQALVNQARSGLQTAEESVPFNPRRLLPRHRGRTSFANYRAVLDALERAAYQLASLTRSLERWREEERDDTYRQFLRCYGTFLGSLEEIVRVLAQLDETHLREQARQLCELAEDMQEQRKTVTEQAESDGLPLGDPTRPYGVLVIEATRLTEEFQYTCDVLQTHVQG
ncbi:PE_PGRS family protein [Streptomyces himastatinicus ATCC 53653]|uniref:PE_PGRS family protein n=1 Tax=Streptomyces himastatinicus ATCC 53653 TaxID=457427 RepID=D9WCY7_9ACTN|nr:aromatic acid exporter family protein [Streptomyces himastatinicus]EFL23066.1 PE_PGRS family protein [Streptomyces himastatinicus ATCC 53653]